MVGAVPLTVISLSVRLKSPRLMLNFSVPLLVANLVSKAVLVPNAREGSVASGELSAVTPVAKVVSAVVGDVVVMADEVISRLL